MLSYQHGFHAGNLADIHKHALLAVMLDYLCRKDKPLSYLESHAGRGLYDLNDLAARKTGEAAAGIIRAVQEEWFTADHPYMRALSIVRAKHGASAYPGSPLLAAAFLRNGDMMHLAELHPQENRALEAVMPHANIYRQDGFQLAQSLCPPSPRRGILLIDPSYEVKDDYQTIAPFIGAIHRKWNVGVIALWYPILPDQRHLPMLTALKAMNMAGALSSEVLFDPARPGHGMVGSGMFVVNAPYGLEDVAAEIADLFAATRQGQKITD